MRALASATRHLICSDAPCISREIFVLRPPPRRAQMLQQPRNPKRKECGEECIKEDDHVRCCTSPLARVLVVIRRGERVPPIQARRWSVGLLQLMRVLVLTLVVLRLLLMLMLMAVEVLFAWHTTTRVWLRRAQRGGGGRWSRAPGRPGEAERRRERRRSRN
jgi:hypothetical protein